MKLSAIFLLALCLNTSAKGVAQKVSLSQKSASLEKIFREIERQTGYTFVSTKALLKKAKPVTIRVANAPIKEVLDICFQDQSLTYSIVNTTVVVIEIKQVLVQQNLVAIPPPDIVIKGKVTNDKNEPLGGATVIEKGTSNATITSDDGTFSIRVTETNAVLVISYIGYSNKEVKVGNQTTFQIVLGSISASLDDVVIVAYGKTTKKLTTGAIQSVDAKELQNLPAGQITQKLQGKLTGVQINQTTGMPGGGMQVRIRGAASISTGTEPLYVVDGFPIVGDISNINPDEIETITVLKDAAATALYGSRAAFGVVVVTTKNAQSGKTSVSVNAYTGSQKVPQKGRPDMMNATEWAQFKKESFEDLGLPVPDAFQNPSQYGEGYDWYDAMFRKATINNYSVTLSSNTDKVKTAVTAGYFDQKGVLLNSNFKRYSVRANTLFKVNDYVRVGLNVAPMSKINNTPPANGIFFGSGGLIYNALLTPPIINYQNPDGSMPESVTTPGITAFPTPNWVRSLQEIVNKSRSNILLSNAYIEVEPIKQLVLKSSVSVDVGQDLFTHFQPSTASRAFFSTPSTLSADLTNNNFQYYSWLTENTATYAKKIKNHHFDVLGGYTVQRYRSDYSGFYGYGFSDDRIRTIANANNFNRPSTDIQEWSLISYLGRLNYNFQGKYFLGASIRRDGSSRFGANNKWGNFPSVSAGWILTEESFMQSLKPVSFLKLRGSWGITGNNNIGNYTQYPNVIGGINTAFGNNTASGSAVVNLGNTELGWEATKQVDIGMDLGLFKDRINVTYDYYNKKTNNLLYTLAVPRESGFDGFTGNVGEIKFWGHEIGVNSKNLVGTFKWNTNFNIAFSDNKVLALSSLTDTLYSGTGIANTITTVGGRIGQFWGLVQEGVYVDQNDFDKSPKNVNSQVGAIKFKDINGDGVIKYGLDEGDRTIIGNPFPKFVFGITNSFSYKSFDLSVVASGSYGNDIARLTDQGTTNLDGVFNVLKEVKDRWRSPSNPGSGKYGKTTGSTNAERDFFHSRFVQDGSYLAIKNITFGYALPTKKLSWLSNARLYASVQQAFVFTKYKGANPEVSTDSNGGSASSLTQGLDFSSYPVPRTFTVGINLNIQ